MSLPWLIAVGSLAWQGSPVMLANQDSLHASGDAALYSASTTNGVLQVAVKKRGPTAYSVQAVSGNNSVSVSKGDVVFIKFRARAIKSRHESGDGNFGMYFQSSGEPWYGYLSSGASVGRNWRWFYSNFTADRDIPVGAAQLTFHIGAVEQTLVFADLSIQNMGRIDPSTLPITQVDYPGREPNAPWRKTADQWIEKYRKGDVVVQLVDRRGRPLGSTAVKYRLKRHAYEFGSFVEQPLLWKNAEGDRYREWFLKAYNKATTPMYWSDWGWENPEEQARYFGYADWFKANRIPTKAHVLIYPGWQFFPAKLKALENDPKALWTAMSGHIREKLNRTKKYNFVSWDIINETRDLRDLPKSFGSEKVYADIFRFAHSIDPKPTFYINENTIITGSATEVTRAEYERIIRYLRDQKAPLEGIGFQVTSANL